MAIRFGTSGWRAIIASDFTFSNVELVTRAICRHILDEAAAENQTLIIGHDSRFMGEQFARVSADIASKCGFTVLLCDNPTPTPTISHAIRTEKAAGALNFTASHNPPEYQGIKCSTADGAPALPEVTKKIEQLIIENAQVEDKPGGSINSYDPKPAYLEDLKRKVRFDLIAGTRSKFAFD